MTELAADSTRLTVDERALLRHWPLFGLQVTTPKLSLRMMRDHELAGLFDRTGGDVLTDDTRDFMGPWTQVEDFYQGAIKYHWLCQATWTPSNWTLPLGVWPAGEEQPVGVMTLDSNHYALGRSFNTGSWLLPSYRGRGLGREARAGALQLGFAGLGALEARSAAHPGNKPSNGVSRSLGYQEDGSEPILSGGPAIVQATRLLLRRENWTSRDDIVLHGVQPCLRMFGLDNSSD